MAGLGGLGSEARQADRRARRASERAPRWAIHWLASAKARSRGWHNLRLLSCGTNTFKYDLASEDADYEQDSLISVFSLDTDGTPRHTYTSRPRLDATIDELGIDALCPLWNLLNLTPHGRGDWYADLSYPDRRTAIATT